MKILFAADGSKHTKKALAYLVTHEGILGSDGEVVVLNVQAVMPTRVGSMLGAAAVKEYYGEQADAVLNPIKKFLDKHNMRYRCNWVSGSAADEIVRASKRERCHLIVMGTHGRGFVGQVMMGSVAQRVIAESDMPVMLVR
jgi:nucleotide-binding universal stress UspA family protein